MADLRSRNWEKQEITFSMDLMCQKEFTEYYESRNRLLVYPLGISSLNQASSRLKVAQLL